MTLGTTPTIPEILQELGKSLPYTFPSTETRWLAGKSGSSSLILPTDFANKSRIRLLAQQANNTPGATMSFSGLECGEVVTNRMFMAVIGTWATGTVSGAMTVSGAPTINGSGSTTGNHSTYTNASGNSVSVVVNAFQDTTTIGANGSCAVTYANGNPQNSYCFWLAVYDTDQVSPVGRETTGASAGSVTSMADTIDVTSPGQVVGGFMQANTDTASLAGLTKRGEVTVGSARFTMGYDTQMATETGRAISSSWDTGTILRSMVLHSRTS